MGTRRKSSGTAENLSAFLLDLYRLAREQTLADFQQRALLRLGGVLSFDGAWWGMGRQGGVLHTSYPHQLEPGFVDDWYRVREHDVLAESAQRRPGMTVCLAGAQLEADPVFAAFCARHRVRAALCTVLVNPTLRLGIFLSLYRFRRGRPFTEDERRVMQLVMPHLWAAWTANWIAQLASAHAQGFPGHVALAVADHKGVLLAAEPGFFDLIRQEWNDWFGPELPALVLEHCRAGDALRGGRVVMRLHPACGLFLVEIGIRSTLDRLTPRELMIARRFASGSSYKDIATALPIAPATVRAHLRRIYSKLQISDKAELAGLFGSRD
jgi:DNA-binding CsgD family transcriptional regulator